MILRKAIKPKRAFFLTSLFILALLFCFSTPSSLLSAATEVYFIQLNDDTINPVTAEYITRAIARAEENQAMCLIIKLDTPGGLLSSTRLIVKRILAANIPVIVYIAPSGSRAGSAGVFITYASHIAAMAPSTNIGAAHPVQMGEEKKNKGRDEDLWKRLNELLKKSDEVEKMSDEEEDKSRQTQEGGLSEEKITPDDDPMSSKILQDTVAFIKALAKERNRNVEWAIQSVTESSSITDQEALKLGVVELIAQNDHDLLEKLDGQTVEIDNTLITLKTKNASIKIIDMDWRQKLLNILANPNIAYILLILGFYGLLYEITHPGIGVPGILGAIFLIFAFFSMQLLPTNYAGIALILLGVILFIIEATIPGFGLPTIGGVIAMSLGSILLFKSADPVMQVSKVLVISVSGVSALLSFFIVKSLFHIMHKKSITGQEGMIDQIGTVQNALKPGQEGKVFVQGEIWNAKSSSEIQKGEKVRIIGVSGMMLTVEKN